MTKKILVAAILLIGGFSLSRVGAEELNPQYRVWKSSWLGNLTYTNTLISSSPIIFHMVYGSATVNSGTNNTFFVHRDTSFPLCGVCLSTKTFVKLNEQGGGPSGIGSPLDVFSDSYTYFSKTGTAVIGYEWDWYKTPPILPRNIKD